MTKIYNTKKFIKRLNLEQLKTLISLCALESDQETNSVFYHQLFSSLEDVTLTYDLSSEWDCTDFVHISSRIGKEYPATPYFLVDDFSLQMCSGYYKKYFNEVLYKYLSSIFGEEYLDYLYEKRVRDAKNERDKLLVFSKKDKQKLHLVIGEDIPENSPKEFCEVVLYERESDNSLKLYAEVSLPYIINYIEFDNSIENDPRYFIEEGHEEDTKCCRYSAYIKPYGDGKGVYRTGIGYPIKLCLIEPVNQYSRRRKIDI